MDSALSSSISVYIPSSQPNDEDKLSSRLHNVIKDALLSLYSNNIQISFNGGADKISLNELNGLFSFYRDSMDDVATKKKFDEDLSYTLRLIEGSKVGEYRICEVYPLLRKILLIMEGYLRHIYNMFLLDTAILSEDIHFGDDLVCDVLDRIYDSCGVSLNKEVLLSRFDFNAIDFDTAFSSIERLSTAISHVIEHVYSNDSNYRLEIIVTSILSGYLQRLISLLVVIYISTVDKSRLYDKPTRSNDCTPTDQQTTIFEPVIPGIELSFLEYLEKLKDISISILSLPFKFDDVDLLEYWSIDMVVPILLTFKYGFAVISQSYFKNHDLSDLLFYSAINYVSNIPNTFFSGEVYGTTVKYVHEIVVLHVNNLTKLNGFIKSHFCTQYNQVQNTHNGYKSTTPLVPTKQIVGYSPTNYDSVNRVSLALPNTSASSRDISTYFQINELKSFIEEYNVVAESLSKYCEHFFNVILSNSPGENDCYIELIDAISQLVIRVTTTVIYADGLVYITRKNPNLEVISSIKLILEYVWHFLSTFVNHVPFDVISAIYYYIGSKLNDSNVDAQVYIFNIILNDFDIDNPHLSSDNYPKVISMLESLMKCSGSICSHFISFEHSNSLLYKQLRTSYLSLSFFTLCKLFIAELVKPNKYSFGILDLFVSWCCSDKIYENLIAKSLCRFTIELMNTHPEYIPAAKYLMDIVLGLCFSGITEIQFIKIREPLDPSKINVFRYLKILAESTLSTWLLENVVVIYTCAIVKCFGDIMRNYFHTDERCICIFCSFTCYYPETINGTCNCVESPIVNDLPSIRHYLELVASLPWDKYQRIGCDTFTNIMSFTLMTLNNILIFITQTLLEQKGSANLEMRFTLFTIAIKITHTLVKTGNFETDDSRILMLLKLFSLLGCSQVCISNNTSVHLDLISQSICILDGVTRQTPTLQLLELHNGLLGILMGKLVQYPYTLLTPGNYRIKTDVVAKNYLLSINNMLGQVNKINSRAIKLLYNCYIWKFCKLNGANDQPLGSLFIDNEITNPEEPLKFRLFVNLAFIFSCSITDATFKKCDDVLMITKGT
ncbi:conserved hypothetical protein [Theileria equi strain WA]|uniref:Uncharacterized protein n=1 Tax=Theileria equi strain WA TaxID=1537102 RepID=L1LCN5_THEEQ|nr:conserved hypothetical protein [Theileria equi strain WA]EKX72923.1 conserved hypothetical protein [Theileria equi strain WA]|eukprot:XP_004832375.1 conserved hypothetical protein [Theileria equi strain WA]